MWNSDTDRDVELRAIVGALDVIEPALAGEYSYAQYRKDERRAALLGMLPLLIFFAAVMSCEVS